MLINAPTSTETDNVKFISYSGKYPNLCSGELMLEIEGEIYTFGKHHSNYPLCFWETGGGCEGRRLNYSEYTTNGSWIIDYNKIPPEFRKYAVVIDYLFNSNVEQGCCGGCL